MKSTFNDKIKINYSKVNREDMMVVYIIYIAFVTASSIQFIYIAKLSLQISNYIMPMVMSTIFSIIVTFLRILRRTLNKQLLENIKANQKILDLNENLSVLLEKRTLLLHEAQDQITLAQTRSDLGALASGVIHDLNNALMIVEQNFSIYQDLKLSEEKEEILQDLQIALAHAKELTASFKRLLRPSKKQQTNVYRLLEKLYPLLQKLFINQQNLKLQLPKDNLDEHSYIVTLSEVQMTQIIMNLVINARDALENKVGDVQIKLNKKKYMVQLIVSDTGMGMSDEIQSKIFQAFFTSKEEGKGTGLGLHVLKQTIDLVHGKIEIESQPQQGSTFYISIPSVELQLVDTENSMHSQHTPTSPSHLYDFWS